MRWTDFIPPWQVTAPLAIVLSLYVLIFMG